MRKLICRKQKPVNRNQKNLILVTVLCLLVTSFLGCVKRENDSAQKTINVWHWMSDRDDAFQKLAKKYEAETGVKINFELYAPSDAYSQKVRASAQAVTLPDIYGLLGEKRDFAAFIQSGHVLDLTAYLEAENGKWKNELFQRALVVNEFKANNQYNVNAGFYGIPIDVTNIQMVYNKDIFKQLGLDPEKPPKTWAEFLAIGKKLKASGIKGLVSGWGEIWMIDCFASNYAFNIMGEEKVMKTIKGEVSYTDPDWIKVFDLFKQLADNNILVSGIVTMVNKTAEQMFAMGRAAFAFNGSWCVNVYYGMNPNLNYGIFLPPQASDKYPLKIWGGAGSSFLVNARSGVKEEAVKFLQWLTAEPQQELLAVETKNLPSNKNTLKGISPVLAQFAKATDMTTHPSSWAYNEFPAVIETFNKGIQSIIIGEKTPEQLAKEVQAVKARELKKASR